MFRNLRFTLPPPRALVSWRAAALALALLNLKNLPFAWHLRFLYHLLGRWGTPTNVRRELQLLHDSSSHALDVNDHASAARQMHPIFAPVAISTRSPLAETDYNLHKSNSTYFSDLDISRTALVSKLYAPGFAAGNAALEAAGHRGTLNVILGAVYASFRREIRPYEAYEVRSRVLAWDAKWLVIASWFVKPAARGKADELVFASALSKYVLKKGRFTVPPETALARAGWLPLPLPLPTPENHDELAEPTEAPTAGDDASSAAALAPAAPTTAGWTYEMVDEERRRGLEVAENWLALDGKVYDEFPKASAR